MINLANNLDRHFDTPCGDKNDFVGSWRALRNSQQVKSQDAKVFSVQKGYDVDIKSNQKELSQLGSN